MFSVLVLALWFLAPVAHCAILYRMWDRRLHRDYPLFFAYIVAHLITFPVVLYIYRLGDRDLYRYTYVGYEALDALFKFAVICEVFGHIFRAYEGIRGLGSVLLRWASAILLLLAVIVAPLATGTDADRFLAGLFAIQRSVEIIQGGLLFLLFVMSSSLGLRWDHDTLGVALGYGLLTSVNLAAFTLRVQLGVSSTDVLSLIANAGYDCAVLVWLATLYARKPVHQFEQRVPAWDVEAWNRALLEFLRQ